MSFIHSIVHFLWVLVTFNWGIPISVWIAIAGGLGGLLGILMAAHPPTPEQIGKKWFYKITFGFLVFLIIGLTWRQNSNEDHEKTQTSNQIADLTNQLNQAKQQSSTQYGMPVLEGKVPSRISWRTRLLGFAPNVFVKIWKKRCSLTLLKIPIPLSRNVKHAVLSCSL